MALDNDVKRLDQASGTTTPQTTSPAKQDDASASTSTSTSGSSTAGSLFTSDQNSTQTTSQPKASSSGSVFTDAKEAKKTETATAQNTGSAEPKKPKKEKDFTEKEVIDFINSLDKALPEKEKIKLIKKHFALKNKKDITELIQRAQVVATTDKLFAQLKIDSQLSTEKLNKEMREKLDEEIYIDALQRLSGKSKEEATKIYRNNKKNTRAEETPKKTSDEPLVTDEELLSPEWKNKTYKEKIDVYMELYLERNDKKYTQLSDDEKEAYRQKEIQKLNKFLKENNRGIGLDNANASKQMMMLPEYINVLEALNKKETSIDQFLNWNPNRQKKFIKQTNHETSLNNTIEKANNIKNLISEERRNSEEWKKLTKEEKLYIYADAYFTKNNPEYAKLSPEDKKTYLTTKTDEVLSCILGDLSKELSTNDLKKEKDKLLEIATQCLELAEQGKLTKKELDNITYSTMAKEMDHETVEAFNDIIAKNPNANIRQLKQAVRKNDSISGNQKNAMLKTLRHLETLDSDGIVYEKKNYHKIALQNNCDTLDEFINQYITKESSTEQISELAQNISPKEILILKARLEKLGFDKEYITKTLSASRDFKIAEAMTEENGAKIEEELHCQNTYCDDREGVIRKRNTIFQVVKLKTVEDITLQSVNRGDREYIKDNSAALNETFSPETVIKIQKNIAKSDEVSDAGKAIAAETIIETAKSDTVRVQYSKELSSDENTSAAFLEGLAAGSKYVTTNSAKTEYNSYVETAAASFPPETQSVIKTAMKTGKVSQETLSRTTPPAAYDSPSESSRSSGNKSSSSTGNYQPAANNSAPQASPQAPVSTPIAPTGPVVYGASNHAPTTTPNIIDTTSDTRPTFNTPTTRAYSPSENDSKSAAPVSKPHTTQNKTQVKDATTSALEAKRDAVGEKILQYQEHVKESYIERTNKNISEEDAKTIAEIITTEDSSNIPEEMHEKIKEIFEKNNINAIYDIITTEFGANAQEKFIEVLAKYGSSEIISAFVNDKKNDSTIIKTLYLKCTNKMVKSELLSMLPKDTIHQMISDGIIANLNDIDTKILKKFLLKNGAIMSNSNFASYRKYFSLDDWTKILNERNTARGIISPKTNPQDTVQETPESQTEYAKNPMQSNPAFGPKQPKQPEQNEPIPQTRFQAGETVKTLSDGTVITNQGTTFAGISNNIADDAFKIVDKPKQNKEGSPIGMNDEVLTPGSEEWKRKYNKQQEPPKTAFTMASMDEDEDDFGMPFGSNKVGMGTKINKKFPKGFRFNA